MLLSPLALLLCQCVVLYSKPALGKQVPIFVWRDPPTSSPTSTPSYQPSLRPSLQPTSHPSSSPSTSWPPSNQPSYLTTSNAKIESLKVAKPSSYAFWLIISIVGIICCSIVASVLVLKSKRFQKPEDKQEKQVKQSNEDKDGRWFGTSPVAAAGGMVTTFLSSVPSRLEELSVYSESGEGPAQGSSGQLQQPCVKHNTKTANRFDFRRLRPAALNGKSGRVSPQSGQGQQPPPSDATNTFSLNTSSLNTFSTGKDMDEMADQIIQEHSEEIMDGVMTEKLGQAFTRLGALVEEAIFPIKADDSIEEDRQRKEHRGSRRHDRNRSSDRYESGGNQSHHRSDQDNSLSIATDSLGSNSEDDSSSSSASRDRFESFEYSASSLSEEEYDDNSATPSSSFAMMPQPVASYDKSVYKTILSSLHSSAVLKPIHVTLTDNSPQHASAGYKNWQSGGCHFSLDIVAEEFEGLTMARRHRLIYMLLGNTMEKIYSLEIKARSPSEV